MVIVIVSILFIIMSIIIIGAVLYLYYKTLKESSMVSPSSPVSPSPPRYPSSSSTPSSISLMPTERPLTTKFLYTEQVIKSIFQAPEGTPYVTSFSEELATKLYKSNIKMETYERFKYIYPHKQITFPCYILFTNVFWPKNVTEQVNILDTSSGNYSQEAVNQYEDEYDLIGAYFFFNFYKYLNENDKNNVEYKVSYYDSLKKIVIPKKSLIEIFNKIRPDDYNSNNYNLFTLGVMPMSLDDFVPKISKYLYYNLRNNPKTAEIYTSWLNTCIDNASLIT